MSAPPTGPSNRILGFTKFLAVLLGSVVLYACLVLTLFPAQSVTFFAWNIQPPMTASFIGAAYANGVVFFASVLLGKQWHRVWAPHVGVFSFATLLLIATYLHWDRFTHGHPVFWAWVFIYVVAPVLTPWAVWTNRPEDPRRPADVDAEVPLALRIVWGSIAVVVLIAALAAFIDPARAIAIWPWRLTPLTTRVVAAFYTLLGVGPLAVIAESRWSAWRVGTAGMATWHALVLIAAFRHAEDFSAGLFGWWLLFEALTLGAILVTFVAMEKRVRPIATPRARS